MNVELPMCTLDWINHNKIYYENLSYNTSEGAMRLQEKNPDKINWRWLSGNPSAIQLLEKNPDKINWFCLCNNPSEGAIRLLEQNPDRIDWNWLSANSSKDAMQLLEKYPDKINWHRLSQIPYIFKYDYKQMNLNCMLFKEDLMKKIFHPRNIPKFKDWRIDGFDSDLN